MADIRGISFGTALKGTAHYLKMRSMEKLHPFNVPAGGKFSKPGLIMDEDAYVMAMHEPIAVYYAQKLAVKHLVEICSGAGSMTVQFGRFSDRVSTIEMDLYRSQRCVPHNTKVYGVNEKVTSIWGNAMHEDLLKSLAPAGAVWADPDWLYDVPPANFPIAMTQPPIPEVFEKVNRLLTPNMAFRMVRTTRINDVLKLGPCRIEYVYWDNKLKFLVSLFGNLASEQGIFEINFSSDKGFLSSQRIK